jgi:hypothetical protein
VGRFNFSTTPLISGSDVTDRHKKIGGIIYGTLLVYTQKFLTLLYPPLVVCIKRIHAESYLTTDNRSDIYRVL